MRTPRSPYSRWSALIRPSHARTYGQWLHDWTRTRTGASAYSSSEWSRPSTPGSSKVGAVSMTLTEGPPRVAGGSGPEKDGRREDGTHGRPVQAAPRLRPGRRPSRRCESSAIRETLPQSPHPGSAPRASQSAREPRAPRAAARGAPSPPDTTGTPPSREARPSSPRLGRRDVVDRRLGLGGDELSERADRLLGRGQRFLAIERLEGSHRLLGLL